MNATTPSIAVTLGDTQGIGPELSLKVANAWVNQAKPSHSLRFYGDIPTGDALAVSLGLTPLQTLASQYPTLIALHATPPTRHSGEAAYLAVKEAVKDALNQRVLGVVTNPISKANWWQAGIPYTGHTEALEALVQAAHPHEQAPMQADMFFVYQNFRLLLLTRHVPLSQVSQTLNLEQAQQSLSTLITHLRQSLPEKPLRLALLGVNPHAGEIGGAEEARILRPLQAWVHEHFPQVEMSSPLPADAFFRGFQAGSAKGYDAVVSPYHDQGLIAMKLLGGFEAVNVTIGLPFLRTSVSHGMASDIVGQGLANPLSLNAAIQYVCGSHERLEAPLA